ncbi:MAG: response regulator [Xanthobacteraceae bacterium]|nr:response regulator [Xanthobacteraceae bacterium]MBV9627098.1 response regulator [Xanthobacteraceae bacterium]
MATVGNGNSAVVLVVEDEELARLIIADYLKDAGFIVLESSNAEDALALLETRTDVRAVVLDVVMPGTMDGIALAHRIYGRWPRIGLLVVSGRGPPKATQLPPGTGFLPKPYFGPSIVGRVRAIIDTESDDD